MNISDWPMLYIEYNFYRWLADVGPTLARRSKSRWPNVGSQRRTDGCADVGPTSVRRRNAIWDDDFSNVNEKLSRFNSVNLSVDDHVAVCNIQDLLYMRENSDYPLSSAELQVSPQYFCNRS